MIRIGLTGSIGMGKSTTAEMFAARDVPVWDADAAVHRLYATGGAAVAPMKAAFPEAVGAQGVDRMVLKRLIAADASVLPRVERIVHPLVAADRAAFTNDAAAQGHDVILLDIPLLFETGSADDMDLVVVVSAPPEVQRARVLARGGMTEAQFDAILTKQMPDADKRARADIVIDTRTLDRAERGVDTVMDIAKRQSRDA